MRESIQKALIAAEKDHEKARSDYRKAIEVSGKADKAVRDLCGRASQAANRVAELKKALDAFAMPEVQVEEAEA